MSARRVYARGSGAPDLGGGINRFFVCNVRQRPAEGDVGTYWDLRALYPQTGLGKPSLFSAETFLLVVTRVFQCTLTLSYVQNYLKHCIKLPSDYMYKMYIKKMNFMFRLGPHLQEIFLYIQIVQNLKKKKKSKI